MTRKVVLGREGDRSFEADLADPDGGRKRPGLLIMSEMFGVTEARRQMARDYAQRGFCALVPNFFWRSEPPGEVGDDPAGREQAWARLDTLDYAKVSEDIQTATQWLRAYSACSGRIGAIGFCMGGRLAVMAATRAGIDVAISLYALGIADHLAELAAIEGSLVQLHYGLADKFVPLAEIDSVVKASAANPNIEIALYPGIGHGFFNPERATYSADAVERAQSSIDRALARLA